ncbi:MAG TPA: hypothetical protein VGR08_02695, partial [Thermomicrobiales bacterium]|nr:hypothetical protein [Thermomicrobiales bacterium]
VERSVYRLWLRLQHVVDLRDPASVSHAGNAPWFLDRDLARAVARSVRATGVVQALIVPSIAFLDDLSRWNPVVFLETLPADASAWITRTQYVGPCAGADRGQVERQIACVTRGPLRPAPDCLPGQDLSMGTMTMPAGGGRRIPVRTSLIPRTSREPDQCLVTCARQD